MFDFDIDFKLESSQAIKEDDKTLKAKKVKCFKRRTIEKYRRAFSETQLLDVINEPFEKGWSYNFLTAGDVDGLSYAKVILRQQNIDYMLMSTWVMATEDVCQIEDWYKEGKIKRLDMYVGEVFPKNYAPQMAKLKEIQKKYNGKLVVFKNHSKIMAGYGGKFHFVVQGSANINTNPRTENACITISEEAYQFYRDFFDDINSFE